MDVTQKKNIVIIGGGVIGSSTAYYLTRHPKFNPSLHTITLLEATAIAAGASGKSGGLLGLWAYPECLVPLSYRLHKELADQYGGAEKWGYRRLACGSIAAVVKTADLDARKAAVELAKAKLPAAQPGMSDLQAQGVASAATTASQPELSLRTTETEAVAGAGEKTQAGPPSPRPEPSPVDTKGQVNGVASQLPLVVPPVSRLEPALAATIEVLHEDGENGENGENQAADNIATAKATGANDEDDKDGKDWEKLPKQDAAATSLLANFSPPPDLDWIDPKLVLQYEEMGRRGFTETAQVHPLHFTNAIAELAASGGVDIRIGAKVTGIMASKEDPDLKIIEYEDRNNNGEAKVVDGVTDVIVAGGPWTGKLLPRSKVEGLRAHSVVYEAEVSPYAVFTDIQLPGDYVPEHRARAGQKRRHRGNVDPEVYARPFGEVYACGEPDKTAPLPDTADQVRCDEAQCNDLIAYLGTISPVLAAAPIKAKQACYLPQHVRFGTERGPLIGPTSQPRVWIAAGHTCWGIQNGPGTGYLMAEWIFDGQAKAADVDVLHPAKFKV